MYHPEISYRTNSCQSVKVSYFNSTLLVSADEQRVAEVVLVWNTPVDCQKKYSREPEAMQQDQNLAENIKTKKYLVYCRVIY